MPRPIPLQLDVPREIDIDGNLVAAALDLDIARFRQLMDAGKVTLLCERGTGDDAGLHRATFYFEDRRARLVVDADGRIVGDIET